MKPGTLMSMGASVGGFCLALSFIGQPSSQTIVLVFAAGAIFGKGYGVWEERTSRRNALDKERGE
ncbi:hypothetical protein B5M44_22025 [Shinella sumterensis]|uniref:hypothetical protein n=1 Tax=Shinella sumterensis TaxID=1967501 RepID=UPI00106E0864|nr:hypothetical protein [Shinella sumterensis]MCD1266902.1 hypothetical protein [Shinella sumterensis]TFE95216.1 hypothetical protein B5M44_22025 [Shinella sumterensis]